MKYAIVLLLLLSGCSTPIAVKQPFPNVPQELLVSCPDPKPLKDNPTLSDVAISVTENYQQYKYCQALEQSWIDWYQKQKALYKEFE